MKYAHAAVFMLLAAVAVEAVIMMGAEELKMRDVNMQAHDLQNVSCVYFLDGPLCSAPEINETDLTLINDNLTKTVNDIEAARIMHYCPTGEFVNGSNYTSVVCGAPPAAAGGGGGAPEFVQAPQITTNISIDGGNLNFTGNITFNSDASSDYPYLNVDGGATVVRLTSDIGAPVGVQYVPEENTSRAAFLTVRDLADDTRGDGFAVWGANNCVDPVSSFGCRNLFPFHDSAYGLGKPTLCWGTFYYDNLVDCGSRTVTLIDKPTIPLLEKYADAKLSSTTQDYAVLTPEEFKTGERGSCGQDLINTDEVINALVIATRELNAKIKVLQQQCGVSIIS